VVRLERLSKSWRGRKALDSLSLEIAKGEIFGLLGHNGAGKSTTFGMMLGHVHPDGGDAFIAGHSVTQDRPRALEKVGAIFETPSFYDYMSGWQNLRFFVSLSGAVSRERMQDVLRLVGLEKRINDPVRTYSHGMRQRLALAQALLPDPDFILLDEPTEGLDPQGIREMREMILRLRDEHGLTILLSSHLLSEVEQLCDRVAILHQGRLMYCGNWRDARPEWELEVDAWDAADRVLAALKVVRTDSHVALPDGLEIADVVDALVRGGVRVSRVQPFERTLESFYLERTTG
jgi:ABC-2 type transport system ATP-binding protein